MLLTNHVACLDLDLVVTRNALAEMDKGPGYMVWGQINLLATGALADVRALLTYGERLDQALAETQLLREFAAQAQASMHTLHAVLATEQTQRQRAQAEIVSLKAHHAAEVAAAHEQMVQGELVRALERQAEQERQAELQAEREQLEALEAERERCEVE